MTKKYIELNLYEKNLHGENINEKNNTKRTFRIFKYVCSSNYGEDTYIHSFKVKIKNKMYLLSILKRCSTTLIKFEVIGIHYK